MIKTQYSSEEVGSLLKKFPKQNYDLRDCRSHDKFINCVFGSSHFGYVYIIVCDSISKYGMFDLITSGTRNHWRDDISDIINQNEQKYFRLIDKQVEEFFTNLNNNDECGLY